MTALRRIKLSLPLMLLLGVVACAPSAPGEINVKDQAEFKQAVANAKPGDVITLANGTWKDFEILFTGTGEADQPISFLICVGVRKVSVRFP